MKRKSIAIIGAGMGGLAAGVYGQLNGYDTGIFEMHSLPGGQCAAWKRKGYMFDGCIHHLFGCSPASRFYELWEQLGAVPRRFVPTPECVSVLSRRDKLFRDYYDLDLLESHMNELAPYDHKAIHDYVNGIRAVSKSDVMGTMTMGSRLEMVGTLPSLVRLRRWLTPTMGKYARNFANPTLRDTIPYLVYGNPEIPLLVHLTRHAYALHGAVQWPVGGALEFAQSIAARYKALGGTIHYRSKVTRILTDNGRATGIRLEDGTEHKADIVISNADGRKTIMDMLEGQFVDDRIRTWCEPPADEMQFAVQVYLGVDRDLSGDPSSMIIQLKEPVKLANRECHEIELQTYGFDTTMAPEGKGVIKVELWSQYSYWKQLAEAGRDRYLEAKQEVADRVIDLLETYYFSGLRTQVEVVDVSTLLTWERYTGGTKGLGIYPNRKMSFAGSLSGKSQNDTLPGLADFRFAGTWATGMGALFMNALSGRKTIASLCKEDGVKFQAKPATE